MSFSLQVTREGEGGFGTDEESDVTGSGEVTQPERGQLLLSSDDQILHLQCRRAIVLPLASVLVSTCNLLSVGISIFLYFSLHFDFVYHTFKAPNNESLR